MLFRKKVERICAHCEKGTVLDGGQVLCTKKGFRASTSKCWRFRYDPCKRIPKKRKALDFSKYNEEDYSL